jgi:hypothetical protein
MVYHKGTVHFDGTSQMPIKTALLEVWHVTILGARVIVQNNAK